MTNEETRRASGEDAEKIWFYGRGNERPWCGPFTRDDAIAEGRDHYSGDDKPFEIATGRRCKGSEFMPSVDEIVERMQENAYDEVGEAADNIEPSEEQEKRLEMFLVEWADDVASGLWAIIGEHETIGS